MDEVKKGGSQIGLDIYPEPGMRLLNYTAVASSKVRSFPGGLLSSKA
jgi:hypothetical protein